MKRVELYPCIETELELTRKMNCPLCDHELSRSKYEGLPVFRCEVCAGYLVGNKRVEHFNRRTIESEEVLEQAAIQAGMSDNRKELRCPRCHRRMKKELWDKELGFEIDRCKNCKHIWFDAGELEQNQLNHAQTARGIDASKFRQRLATMTEEEKLEFEQNLAMLPEGDISLSSAFGQAIRSTAQRFIVERGRLKRRDAFDRVLESIDDFTDEVNSWRPQRKDKSDNDSGQKDL